MENENSFDINFKTIVNDLLTKRTKYRPKTRSELMRKIKTIILSNDSLNNRDTDFNYHNEYREMNNAMKKFNQNQKKQKNIIEELSKENNFFTKTYSNMISTIISKLENKNINYQTISNLNTKYMNKNSTKNKERNFFFQNPLLLTKIKDMNNFYLRRNNLDEDNDQYLTYTKKILNKINNHYPSLKINNIINEYNNKTNYHFNIVSNKASRKSFINTFYDNKSLTERNNKENINNTNFLKYNKNFFYEKNKEKISNEQRLSEIKISKKYFKSLSNKINEDYQILTPKEKEISRKESKKSEKMRSVTTRKPQKNMNIKTREFIPLTERNRKRNSNMKILDNLIKYGINKNEINNMKEKINQNKIKKILKLKGSIHIKNIYNDYANTTKIIDEYKRNNTTKLKYLYYSLGKKQLKQFQRDEKENTKIKKLGYNLFWTINK